MKVLNRINENTARVLGKKLKVNFVAFDLGEFKDALNTELDAEIKAGDVLPEDELEEHDLEGIGRVTLAHINPFNE